MNAQGSVWRPCRAARRFWKHLCVDQPLVELPLGPLGCGCGDPPLVPVLVDRWGNRGRRQLLPPHLRLGSELGNVGLAEQGEAVSRRAGSLAQSKVGVTPFQKLPAQLSEAEGARLVQTVGGGGVCG